MNFETLQADQKVPRTCGDDPTGLELKLTNGASAPHLRG